MRISSLLMAIFVVIFSNPVTAQEPDRKNMEREADELYDAEAAKAKLSDKLKAEARAARDAAKERLSGAEEEADRLYKKMEAALEDDAGECGPPKGCYCRDDGVWIGRNGEPAVFKGQLLQCEPSDDK